MRNRVAYLEAEYIIAGATLEEDEKRERLSQLHRLAKREDFPILVENIALSLAELSGREEKLQLLDSVLGSERRGYNQVRAIVAKVGALQESEPATVLNRGDIARLAAAYSYLHAQRFSGLFDRCHDLLWRAFEAAGNTADLLRLFRHSSFVWRIRGDEVRETDSAKRLVSRKVAGDAAASSADIAVRYFWVRLRSLGAALRSLTE